MHPSALTIIKPAAVRKTEIHKLAFGSGDCQSVAMPANAQRPMIPWKRFWCRFDERIHVGDKSQGFLTDPENEYTKFYNPNLFTLDQLLVKSCLVLCGDPGIGKSTVVQQAKVIFANSLDEGEHLILLDFRDIPTVSMFARQTFDSTEWQQWRSSTSKLLLVVDGIDEGLIKIPDFINYLTGQLRNEPVERLKLIVCCRSAEWPVSQGEELISLWGNSQKQSRYELCPLRQCDAELAAEKWGLNQHTFIQSVYQKNVAGLAALPTALFFLLAEFLENKSFGGTHRELFERGCQRFAHEVDPRRTELLRQLRRTSSTSSPQEIYTAAGRISALLLVCGKSAIYTGSIEGIDDRSDLHISEAADESLTEDAILDTISSSLFTSRGSNRFGLAHQTFAECLASQFLSRLQLIQIRSLLCARDGYSEHVIPQLAETAAWLAGRRDDFFDYLCKIEPEVLLRSDVSKVQSHRKSVLVAAVLEKARREELFDERNINRFFDSLKHANLAVQLRPFIRDKSLHTVVRRMAMNIGGDCKEADLTDDFFGIIQDNTESQHIRELAARALEEVIPVSRLVELIPLSQGLVGADPDDSIRAYAIAKLIPNVWSVSQALPAIRSPRNPNHFGAYCTILKYHLPHHLVESDLPKILGRMIRWRDCFDTLSWFHDLAETAFKMALKSLHNPKIRKLAVRVWVLKQQRHHVLPHLKESPVTELFSADESLRREFITAIINDVDTPSSDLHVVNGFHVSIFLQSDFEWALNQIAAAPTERREAWANIIHWSNHRNDICQSWDLLLQRIEEIPELKARFEWLRAWDFNEKMARDAKARWIEVQQYTKKYERPKQALDVDGMIKTVLTAIAGGKSSQWPQLCQWLALEQNQTRISHLKHDLIEYPGWKAADESRRVEIQAAARSFLLNQNDSYAELLAETTYFKPGYIAIWLLRDEVLTNAELKAAVATNWIEALLGRSNNGSERYKITAALAYELNPDAALRFFIQKAKSEDRDHGFINCVFGFRLAWDSRFTEAVIKLIKDENFKNRSIESLLTFLGPIAPNEAAACANELLASTAIMNPAIQDRTVGVLASCFGSMPMTTWSFAWPIMESNSSIAENVLLRVADRFDYKREKFLPSLNENQLATLYLKVHTLFPPETDPPHSSGISGVSSRQAVSWFRGDVISTLEARGTEEACRELLRLANELPAYGVWLRSRHYNARISKRRISWDPPTPAAALRLAKSDEGRLVKDADDLLEVVMESLERFQAQLTRNTLPRSEVLWRYAGADTQQRDFEPHDEAFLSNEVARWLRDDLNQRGVIIGREVQPRRGQRTDIYVEAIARNSSEPFYQTITVVIEVKGCWNAEVKTSVDLQLVGTYLRSNGLTHGIYLVGWFVCNKWKTPRNKLTGGTLELARQEVELLVSTYDGKTNPEWVKGIVLDCRYPT